MTKRASSASRQRRRAPRDAAAEHASLAKGGLLSQTAEYALRTMCTIAADSSDQPARAADLAPATGVPPHYLSKVLRKLVADGLLVSRRGHGGGFTLARSASEITFAEVLRAVDGAPAPGRCAFGWGACGERQNCPIHPAWKRLDDLFWRWAETTTLSCGTRPE